MGSIERYNQHNVLLKEYANRLLALQLNKEWDGSADLRPCRSPQGKEEELSAKRQTKIVSKERRSKDDTKRDNTKL